jgi:hypothetical protein
MNKAELLRGLVNYKESKINNTGIADIIQLVIDIIVEDVEYDKFLKKLNGTDNEK